MDGRGETPSMPLLAGSRTPHCPQLGATPHRFLLPCHLCRGMHHRQSFPWQSHPSLRGRPALLHCRPSMTWISRATPPLKMWRCGRSQAMNDLRTATAPVLTRREETNNTNPHKLSPLPPPPSLSPGLKENAQARIINDILQLINFL